jgi:hypothetical protein
MAWSCMLFLIGAVSFLASPSMTPNDFLSSFSKSFTEPPLPTKPVEICFVSSIYAKSAAMADVPGNFEEFTKSVAPNTFAFFLYTNLEDLRAPGWHKIIKQGLNYRRFITRSRWGKFMGWKDPELEWCKTIFYFDGYFEPSHSNAGSFLDMANVIRKSDVGLAQVKHFKPGHTALGEFELILRWKKDIPKNVEASVKWLKAQPDFFNNYTMYANWYFGTNVFFAIPALRWSFLAVCVACS